MNDFTAKVFQEFKKIALVLHVFQKIRKETFPTSFLSHHNFKTKLKGKLKKEKLENDFSHEKR